MDKKYKESDVRLVKVFIQKHLTIMSSIENILFSIIPMGMQYVSKMFSLPGEEKKSLLLSAIRLCCRELGIIFDEKIASGCIDVLYDTYKGVYKFPTKKCLKCLGC